MTAAPTTLAPPTPAARPAQPRLRRAARRGRWLLRRAAWSGRLLVSAAVLVAVLSVLAAIPVANVYVLGYLLEAEGRVGRGHRWRDVLPSVRYAPRIATVAV